MKSGTYPNYINAMNALTQPPGRAKSNEQLMDRLPGLMATVRPNKARPAMPGRVDEFRPFYKWCFNHFKPEGQKNVPVDVAQVLFQTLLDADKYSPSWQPPAPTANGDYARGCTPGDFPHVNAFVEFLNGEPKPVQVITRDQYEQFYEFNSSVGWDLREHSEDSACWCPPPPQSPFVCSG